MKMVGGGSKVLKVSKVSQILGIINTRASFDTYKSVKSVISAKCVQMVSFRRFFAGIWAAGGRRLPLSGLNAPQKNLGFEKK